MSSPIVSWISDYPMCREHKIVINAWQKISVYLQSWEYHRDQCLAGIYVDEMARLPLSDKGQVVFVQVSCYCLD